MVPWCAITIAGAIDRPGRRRCGRGPAVVERAEALEDSRTIVRRDAGAVVADRDSTTSSTCCTEIATVVLAYRRVGRQVLEYAIEVSMAARTCPPDTWDVPMRRFVVRPSYRPDPSPARRDRLADQRGRRECVDYPAYRWHSPRPQQSGPPPTSPG
jgi:hypothetical protein